MSATTDTTATDTPAEVPTRPAGPPVLIGAHLRVEVVVTSPPDSPFPPITMQVVPFTRAEQRAYSAALADKKGEAFEAEQCKQLAGRIKAWDVHVTPGTVADINPGTVAGLPAWAFGKIEAALYGEAGRLVGN